MLSRRHVLVSSSVECNFFSCGIWVVLVSQTGSMDPPSVRSSGTWNLGFEGNHDCVRTRDESWNVIRHSFTFAPTRFSWCWIRCKRKLMLESQIRSSRVRKLSRFSCDYNPIWMLCQQWDNVPIRIQFKLKSRKQLLELISKRDETKGGWNDTRSLPIPNRFITWSIDLNVENDCQIVRIHLRR